MDFYRALKENGAVQVASPGDVVTGVAEGRYALGIAPDKSVQDAVADGSPIELVWPASGAIAATGWQPIRDDVEWTPGGPAVSPDWDSIFGRQEELLEEYRTIFGD